MMRAGPATAPTGMPPPMTLPKVDRSGVMPHQPCAPVSVTRKPDITSSKISTAPYWVHSSRSPSRKPGCGTIMFMLPGMGSTIRQATSSGYCSNRRRTLSRSL